MIKGINSTGRYVEVVGGSSSPHIGRNYYNGSHNQGQMMYDLESQSIKVFDGQSWVTLHGSFVSVGLTGHAHSLLDWVERKMIAEKETERLIKENPVLKDAHDHLMDAQQKFEMLVTLAKKFETTTTSNVV